MNLRTVTLSTLSAILAIVLAFAIFASYPVDMVTGSECGIEANVPCSKHDIITTVDVLEENRTIVVSGVSVLLVASITALITTSRKKSTK